MTITRIVIWGGLLIGVSYVLLSMQSGQSDRATSEWLYKCVSKYPRVVWEGPVPRLVYGADAIKYLCQAALEAKSEEEKMAALCVADSTSKMNSPSQFRSLIKRCYGYRIVPVQVEITHCMVPQYQKIRSKRKRKNSRPRPPQPIGEKYFGPRIKEFACQAAAQATTDVRREAAVCVARNTEKTSTPSEYRTIVEHCYRHLPIPPRIKLAQCVLPNYRWNSPGDQLKAQIRRCEE